MNNLFDIYSFPKFSTYLLARGGNTKVCSAFRLIIESILPKEKKILLTLFCAKVGIFLFKGEDFIALFPIQSVFCPI